MLHSEYCLILLTTFLHIVHGLYGPNVCQEQQNYTMTTRVKYQQPISIKTYRWCLGIPPRCSSTHIEMKEKWKTQTVVRTKSVEMCCDGFEEDEGRCVPKCPAGFTGELCDQGCPLDKWGPSCTEDCECPENSICNVKNGSCVCLEGWSGLRCNVPLFPATRMPIPRIDKEILKNTNLFDWNKPTMADTLTTERHVTYRNYILSSTPKLATTPVTTEKYTDNKFNVSSKNVKNTFVGASTTTSKTTVSTEKTTPSPTKSTTKTIPTSTKMAKTVAPVTTIKPSTVKGIQNTTSSILVEVTSETVRNLTNVLKDSINKTTTVRVDLTSATVKPFVNTKKPTSSIKNKFEKTTEAVAVSNTKNITAVVNNVHIENITEILDEKRITKSSTVQKSQIESPTIITTSATTVATVMKPTTQNATTQTTTFPSTTPKRKYIKHHKSESDIVNITLHIFANKNETGSKIFKTETISPVINPTQKVPHQKVKVVHESKMITIPVRVIMDSEKSPSNIFLRKEANGSTKADSKGGNKLVTLSPMYTLDVQTEETKHVLTEPEQITSVAGGDFDDENREDILSILTITIGIIIIIIFTATVIVLVTRYRQIKAEKLKNIEMAHVQSMMNVSEDSGYLRNIFHNPLPDPPSHTITMSKPQFVSPSVQATLKRPVSPALMESFRDILECHYDHPRPPRPITTSMKIQLATETNYQVPPSIYQHLNTFRSSSFGANQNIDSADVSLPVTDAAISVLKLEHQTSQTTEFENNKEPVYDEIPPWISETPKNLGKIMYSTDEAITEL